VDTKKFYLGDGASVHDDGFQIVISCQRENGENWIALGPSELPALFNFL